MTTVFNCARFAAPRHVALIGAACLALAAKTGFAQDQFIVSRGNEQISIPRSEVRELAREIERDVQRRQVFPLAADPQLRSLGAAPLNQVALEISKETGPIGKARLSFPLGLATSIDVVLKGNLSSSGTGTPLTSEHGLSDGASFRIGFHQTLWQSISTPDPTSYRLALAQTTANKYERAAMSVLAFAPGRLTAEGPAARLTGHVSAGDPRATGRRVVEEGLVSAESSFFIDAGYERSGHTFEFVDVSDLQRQRLNRIGELVSIGIGYGTTGTFEGIKAPQPLFYAALTFTGGRSFTAGTKQQICIPIAGSLATKCLTTAITGPQSADPQIWKAESRVWLREQKIGLNPEFVYDADQSIRELALNVSALVFKKGESKPAYELDTTALSAGFRIGYIFEGERKGAAASVFFSSVLGMW